MRQKRWREEKREGKGNTEGEKKARKNGEMKEETNQKGKIEGKTDRERNEIKRKGEGGKENYQGKQIRKIN